MSHLSGSRFSSSIAPSNGTRRKWGQPHDPLHQIANRSSSRRFIPPTTRSSKNATSVCWEYETKKEASGSVHTTARYVSSSADPKNLTDSTFEKRETVGQLRQKLLEERNDAYEAVEKAYNARTHFHNEHAGSNDPEVEHQTELLNYVYEAAKEKAKNVSERLQQFVQKFGKSKEEIFDDYNRAFDEYLEYYNTHQQRLNESELRSVLDKLLEARQLALRELKAVAKGVDPSTLTPHSGHLAHLKRIYDRADEAYMDFYNSNAERLSDPEVQRQLHELQSRKDKALADLNSKSSERREENYDLYQEYEDASNAYTNFLNSNLGNLNDPRVKEQLMLLQCKKDSAYAKLQRLMKRPGHTTARPDPYETPRRRLFRQRSQGK